MQRLLRNYLRPEFASWFFILAITAGLSTSKAIMSIATVAFGFMGLWYLWAYRADKTYIRSWDSRWVLLLFLLAVVAIFWTEDSGRWLRDVKQKIPFLCMGVGFMLIGPFTKRQYAGIFVVFCLTQFLLGILSLGIALSDYEAALELVRTNSHIPILGSIHHIYFGLFLGMSVFVGSHLVFGNPYGWKKWQVTTMAVITITNLIILHILGARTALLAFYSGVVWLAAGLIIQQRRWWLGFSVLAMIILLPLASYQLVPAFQLRVDAAVWDLEQMAHSDKDLTNHSASLRVLAWSAAWDSYLTAPWLGVGPGDLKSEMHAQYEAHPSVYRADDLPEGPHNQYLEHLASLGPIGLILLLAVLFAPLWSRHASPSLLMLSFVGLISVGMLFESVLERQAGICFFTIFSLILPRHGMVIRKDH
ncbi:O-antigen ligase family protein [Pontibacter sp. G13]|uniref:O-antigen ligase family protein n=1 Tax=Pontibacter sp. G13 TaxID=3074898 RepID=UPI00288C1E15|nr:O-antigen ligase family protein [Pontibacter sp. G13]WNJ19722.1 O-antigen ligase family protein [Pontibacter sp. G13]